MSGEDGLRLDPRGGSSWRPAPPDFPPPAMSVYAAVRDLDGLAESCRRGPPARHSSGGPRSTRAAAGDRGRVRSGRRTRWPGRAEVLAALDGAAVATLPDGAMVDEAMARRARGILADDPGPARRKTPVIARECGATMRG